MAKTLFLTVMDMSITATAIIPVIMLVRLFIHRAPKKYSYFLWTAVGFRLCCPVSVESRFSIFNLFKAKSAESPVMPQTEQGYVRSAAASGVQKGTDIWEIFAVIWICVALLLFLYGIFNYACMKYRVRLAIADKDNVYFCDTITSPFILGYWEPKIYIPFDLTKKEKEYVIAHERHHLKRMDHIVKALAFIILCVHWFNPLCWLAFIMMSRDMELSCDEKVLSLGFASKKYSSTLLSFAAAKRFPSPAPLAFGEISIRVRIKNILSWKKPALWLSALSLAVCLIVITACACNATKEEEKNEEPSATLLSYTEDITIDRSEESLGAIDEPDVMTPESSEPAESVTAESEAVEEVTPEREPVLTEYREPAVYYEPEEPEIEPVFEPVFEPIELPPLYSEQSNSSYSLGGSMMEAAETKSPFPTIVF